MAKYKPKAEEIFEKKLHALLAPEGYVHDLGGSFDILGDEGEIAIRQFRIENFDRDAVARLLNQYGCYLELIDPNVELTHSQIADHSKEMVALKEES